jgi:hypothetical protein
VTNAMDRAVPTLDPSLVEAVRRSTRASVLAAHPLDNRRKKSPRAYRLILDHTFRSVIAKRVPPDVAAYECHLYGEVLPSLGILVASLLAIGPTQDGSAVWMLFEDLGEERPDPARDDHAELLAAWLWRLHAAAAPTGLPRFDADFYRAELRRCEEILRSWEPQPPGEGRDVRGEALRGVETAATVVDVRAADLTEGSRLVHGDFQAKNLRIVRIGRAQAVAAFDWEMAGVGHPGVDARVFPDTGLARVAPLLSVALDELVRMVSLGRVLWAVRAMGWALDGQWRVGQWSPRRIIRHSTTMSRAQNHMEL